MFVNKIYVRISHDQGEDGLINISQWLAINMAVGELSFNFRSFSWI